MKKKLILIPLLVLVLLASTGTIVPTLADGENITDAVTLGTTYTGIAEWTTEVARCDSHSAKLVWPAPYRDEEANYIVPRAFVIVNIPEGMTIDSEDGVGTWSYWAKAPKNYMPQVTFYVDHPDVENYDDKDYDTTISASFLGLGDDSWIKVDETTIPDVCRYACYVLWIHGKDAPVYAGSWTAIREGFDLWGDHYDFGDAVVKHLKIGKATIGTNQDITAYVDDFTLNGTTYIFEPPPPPKEHPNRLTVLMPFGYDFGRYVSENDNTLRHGIEIVGVYDGIGYKLVIPEGCVLERPSGKRVSCLYLKAIGGSTLTFTTSDVEFSEPCILYTTEGEITHDMWGRLVSDEEWVEVGTFTSIVDREAHLD